MANNTRHNQRSRKRVDLPPHGQTSHGTLNLRKFSSTNTFHIEYPILAFATSSIFITHRLLASTAWPLKQRFQAIGRYKNQTVCPWNNYDETHDW
ncbi:hypothetical protein AMTR_s00022p00228590 [Amborella trichopoda]|uniref:Uncharacterized protein n=1 Tax=Amborella trichopoda TaxID=13333 RepID=W1PUH7_AMBTC|nr:hypothetical protein AMTR_s00022p00228590 [Amborella trichopoda]